MPVGSGSERRATLHGMVAEPLASFLQPGTDPDVAGAYATLAERALETVYGFEEEVVILDLETTGFDPSRDAIIEIGAVLARGPEVVDRFATFVRPPFGIPHETTQLTGITDEMVAEAPPIESLIAPLAEFIGDRTVIAHNASFDRTFLERSGCGPSKIRGGWVDSLEVVRLGLPRLRSHRLADLARAFGLEEGRAHRASDDAEALFGIWRIALTALGDLPAPVLRELARLASNTPGWTLGPILSHLAAAKPGGRAFDLRQLRTDRLRTEQGETLADACETSLTCPEPDAVLAEFDADGVVGRMYEGYERREEQAKMAEAVLEAFGSSRCAAVEAGTGVGKSVAYLLPAALYAQLNGVRVGVATKTNTLMDQLMHRELPRLAASLGGGLRYTALKGYEHYVCLRKFQRMLDAPTDPETAAALGMLLAWTAQSTWGDKEAVNLHWPPALRTQVLASFGDCTKKHCRYYPNHCYLHGARRRAAGAHIIVTNHALLFRDLTSDGGILPPIRHWIVDEAHAAEAEARDQLSLGVGHAEVRGLLGGLHMKGRGGYLSGLRAKAALGGESAEGAVPVIDEMREVVEQTAVIADSFFDFVKDLGAGTASAYDRTELRVTPQVRDAGSWGTVSGVGRSLAKRMEYLLDRGRALVTALEAAGEEFAEQRADLAGQLSGVAEQLSGLRLVLDGTDEGYVYSVTVDRRRDQLAERLDAFLLDVGDTLASEFYPKVYSVVYTSATIAAGSDFSHFERAVGLDRLAHDGYRTLRLESSYDFERQMAVFVPTDLPEPCQPGQRGYPAYIDALAELLFGVHVALGGSVLTLFTNRRDMDELYGRLANRLEREGLRLLVQGRDVSRKRVADEFIADTHVSLFATKSFWEGFDAKGDTLRCVVIPRLPFGPVNDPVLEERRDRDRRWWEHYYLPEAVLELKQAAGRLIRSSTDEGCLVLADARLVGTKSYAVRFLEALPVRDVERLPAAELPGVIEERFGR